MILYHGTNKDFGEIDLEKSKPNKDFGRGFYLSKNYSQAMDMAKIKVEQLNCGSPVVLSFEIDERLMNKLNLLQFDDYNEDWANFILQNRNNASNKQTNARLRCCHWPHCQRPRWCATMEIRDTQH